MADKSILIIGAGLAGLAAGCYAQMSGYQTRIFEQHTRPGGACTAWKRKGYTIDGCIHWLVGARPGCAFHELYCEVGALEGNTLLPLDHLARFVDPAGGQSLDVTADLDRLAADMRSISPADTPLIDELVDAVRAFRGFDLPVGEPPAVRSGGALAASLVQAWQTCHGLAALRRYNVPAADLAARFQDPFLRWVVGHVCRPETPVSRLCIVLAQLAEGKLAAVGDGSLAFALAIARRYLELGGQIVYGAPVREILVEHAGWKRDRAVGVRLQDGTERRADVVISTGDGHSTLFEMLEGRYVDRAIRERYKTWPLFPPVCLVSYGLKRTYANDPARAVLRLDLPLPIAGQEVDRLACRVHQGPAFAPVGKAVVQATFTTDYEYWADLAHGDRARYEAEKTRIAAQVLERLEGLLPGIASAVEMTDVATPYTWQRYTGCYRGAARGWLLTPEHAGRAPFRALPQTLPGLEDFYMAGQWVEPEGGVPQALLSGRQAIQIVCRRDRVPFVATVE